jgi:acetyl-CoA carboxylase carboxyl transferase beta subunit/acetyl-CoA carboxylase carboxyl transferase alpha subunit
VDGTGRRRAAVSAPARAAVAAVADWTRCPGCGVLLYARRFARNLRVCAGCGHHGRLDARSRIRQLVDAGTFRPLPVTANAIDPLEFTDSQPYSRRLAQSRRTTGLDDAVVCGVGGIGGHPVALAVMDFRFMGGSLGCAVGELVTRTAEAALDRGLPLLIVTASGGARMQEGCLSLMQMAKTSQAIAQVQEAGLLTVTLVTDPTYGGVAASFATNTDVLIAEPLARMGFAGPRVIQQTIQQELPDGFQTAEFLRDHGQLDMVVERRELRGRLRQLLAAAGSPRGPMPPGAPPLLVRDPARLVTRDAWEVVRLARDTGRPTTLDYLALAFDEFVELHGDRLHGDCAAVVAGFARLGQHWVGVVGHQKGHSTAELVARNFGLARPEGYRKGLRVMQLAARLGLPIVTLVDTQGAYPGLDAEERGQALAVAQNILQMSGLPTPVVTVVTGEGGSGGALAFAVADRVLMLENAVYSVISPEGCSSILWHTAEAAPEAARALRIIAPELLRLGVADGVVPEPDGGAQRDPLAAANALRQAIEEVLPELQRTPTGALVAARRQRFRRYGSASVDDLSTAERTWPAESREVA